MLKKLLAEITPGNKEFRVLEKKYIYFMNIYIVCIFVRQLDYLKGVVNIFLVKSVAGMYILNSMKKTN